MLRVAEFSILTDVSFHISLTCQEILKMRKSNLLRISFKSMLFTTIVYLVVRTSADPIPTSEKTEYFHEQHSTEYFYEQQSEHPSTGSSSNRRKPLQSRIDIQAVNVHSLPEEQSEHPTRTTRTSRTSRSSEHPEQPEQQSEYPSTGSSSNRRKTLQSRIDIQAVNVHSLPARPPPYVRTSNDFYERLVARPTWTSDSESKETSLHEYPDIYENKGNVFKPKPLRPGPWVTMTKGEIWPKPKYQQINSTFLILDVSTFRINVSTVHP